MSCLVLSENRLGRKRGEAQKFKLVIWSYDPFLPLLPSCCHCGQIPGCPGNTNDPSVEIGVALIGQPKDCTSCYFKEMSFGIFHMHSSEIVVNHRRR